MAKATKRVSRKAAKIKSDEGLDLDSFLSGHNAAFECQAFPNRTAEPPKWADKQSWYEGYQEGFAQVRAREVLQTVRDQKGEAYTSGEYHGVGCHGWTNGFRIGLRIAVGKHWKPHRYYSNHGDMLDLDK